MTIADNHNTQQPTDVVFHGDCIDIMSHLETGSADMILTDPPYITRYRSRDGQTVRNDDNDRWLKPAFSEAYRDNCEIASVTPCRSDGRSGNSSRRKCTRS